MRLSIIGTGYVGLTTTVAMAYLGHDVIAVDKDSEKLRLLGQAQSPIHEPGLQELLSAERGSLSFTDKTNEAVRDAHIVLIAVGTPPKQNGEADTRYVEQAAAEVAAGFKDDGDYVLAVKSTVPIGTNRRVSHVVNRVLNERGVNATVHIVSNPEFLREGFALRDTLYPDRIVVGTENTEAAESLHRLYRPILEQTFAPPDFLARPEGGTLPPLITTDPTSAEMIKYAANSFLALKISYINEIAGLCEKVGADVTEVARGIGPDPRIGPRFLGAGIGWGGSCFPKDTAAVLAVGAEYGYEMPIIRAAREVDARQRHAVVEKLQTALKVLRGRTVGMLGLAFKPNTDDVRESPSLDVIRLLIERGAHVRAHDPVAMQNARRALDGIVVVDFVEDPYSMANGCDALVLATEWECYRHLDLSRLAAVMQQPVLIDGRNLYDSTEARQVGFMYMGVGR